MELSDCYRIIGLPLTATDEEIKKSFKSLAHKYHPDKNPERVEWANEAMANLNKAYTAIMQFRFREEKTSDKPEAPQSRRAAARPEPVIKQKIKKEFYDPDKKIREAAHHDLLTKEFVKIRESTKNEFYRYFQYGIYNIARRENIANKNIFNKIVSNLKTSYHEIVKLKNTTGDADFIKHFDVFSALIYNFYIASECVNVIDSYSDAIEVEAYRLFKRGDDMLHPCEKEIFFDRHNRGFFKKAAADTYLQKSEANFKNMLKIFPHSTWAVETRIKLQYALSLKEYLNLFFSEYGK